jgi:uncharacterized damage-inducible protein DinB
MKRSIVLAVVALAASAAPTVAQVSKDDHHAGGSTVVAANHQAFKTMSAYIVAAAEEMSEADYAYRPVETVRTFGQIVGHVAGANNMFCAAALGEPGKPENDIEKSVTSKAGLVAAMKSSIAYCAKAYAMSDMHASMKTKLFEQDATRAFALALNAAHNGEHYGNIVTYMRIKGMVPPSSK